MNTITLEQVLSPVARRLRQRELVQMFGYGALGYLLIQELVCWYLRFPYTRTTWFYSFGCFIALGVLILIRSHRSRKNLRTAVEAIEKAFPDLNGALLTAWQQPRSGPLEFMQRRILDVAIAHGQTNDWRSAVPVQTLILPCMASAAALLLQATVMDRALAVPSRTVTTDGNVNNHGIEVIPGDAEIERGQNFIVSARFQGTPPTQVNLVWSATNQPDQKLPLTRSLADSLYGGGIPSVSDDFVYRIDADYQTSRSFRVHVFELPKLLRADAVLRPPTYSRLPEKRVEDIHRIAALVGTQVQLTLQLNHPVKSARLTSRSHATPDLILEVSPQRAQASIPAMMLRTNDTYDLRLVDAEGRTNITGSPLMVEALPNRRPEIKITAPKGDIRPSPIEELTFSGNVWDDIGVTAYGLAFSQGGDAPHLVELGTNVSGQVRSEFRHPLALEELHLNAGQLVSWYVWADDFDSEGKPRRTTTDLFFAEIRPFEELFREGKAPESFSSEGNASEQGGPAQKLTELEKQILTATWKLQTRTGGQVPASETTNLLTLRESQKEALIQATAAQKKSTGPQRQKQWEAVISPMTKAIGLLEPSLSATNNLISAVAEEQKALQSLVAMAAREHEVTRQKQRSRSKGSSNSNQRQLDQLELAQSEDKYETQKQAESHLTPQQQAQSEILERLKALARRQEDVNDRLKDIQSQLAAAKTEDQREELRRQLKHLQAEERQMMADTEELQQRMESPENQSALSQQRERLEQTRSEMQKASDAASKGAISQAISAGTRAQQQLQEQREDLRRQSAGAVGEELKKLRSESRELARKQGEIQQQLKGLPGGGLRSLDNTVTSQKAVKEMARQESQLNQLVERARQVAQLAEASEPRSSQKLEETLRHFTQDETAVVKQFRQSLLQDRKLTRRLDQKLEQLQEGSGSKSLSLTSELATQGFLPDAITAGEKAQSSLDALSQGMAQAAASAVGDDTEALRRAAEALENATQELQKEFAAEADSSRKLAPGEGNTPPSERISKGNGTAEASTGSPSETGPTPGSNLAEARSPEQTNSNGGGGSGTSRRDSQGRRQAGNAASGIAQNGAGDGGNPRGNKTTNTATPRPSPPGQEGPITGNRFSPWSDRLRDVEEMVDAGDLRTAVAAARERARQLRIDFKNTRQKPDWLKVQYQIIQPLVEVRQRLVEDLARRNSQEALVPLDRDPIPARYSELVRRYYQELGRDH